MKTAIEEVINVIYIRITDLWTDWIPS